MPVDETRRLNDATGELTDNRFDHDDVLLADRQRRFQRRPVSLATMHGRLVEEVGKRLGASRPHVILCCGKCRVGSTPLANVFGHAGLPTFYQPIKTLLRYLLVEQTCPAWELETNQPIIFIKETFGPYVEAECTFNPLKVLLDAGFHEEDVTLLVLERDPDTAFASWRNCWHKRADPEGFFDRFHAASSNAHRAAKLARSWRIPVEYYLYEESKQPQITIPELFERLGIRHLFNSSILHGWTKGDSLQGSNTAVTFFRQPADYWIEEIHLDLNEYHFVERGTEIPEMIFGQKEVILKAELHRLYQLTREHAKIARPGCFKSE